MKKLLLALVFVFGSAAAAPYDIDYNDGVIYEQTVNFGKIPVGNILDYKVNFAQTIEALDATKAMAAASLSAKPVAFDEGIALGLGVGASGSSTAVAFGLDAMINDSMSFNAHVSGSTSQTLGSDVSYGAGVHYRF